MRALAILFAVLAPMVLVAQTTITKADMAPYLKVGMTAQVYETADNIGAHYNLGDPGAGKTWDFSGMYFFKTGSGMEYVDPGTTTAGAQFPTANLALAITTDGQTAHSFFRFDSDALYSLGYTAIMNNNTIVYPVKPDEPVMQYPAKLGDTWTYLGDPVDINGHVFTEKRTVNTIDADGTLKLPMGTYDCIRKKTVTYSTQKVIVNGQTYSEDVTKSVSYAFITTEGITANMVIDSTFENSSFPFLQSLSYTVIGEASPVGYVELPSTASLDAVYPNPVIEGNTIRIGWTASGNAPVSIGIYDARGAEVLSVSEGTAEPGSITRSVSTDGFVPGMYFVRFVSGRHVETRPFAVLR